MDIKCIVTDTLEENCYILFKENKCLVIDPGNNFNDIKKIIGDNKVLSILITHYHFDHIGALDELKKFYNVSVIDYKSNKKQKINCFDFKIIDTKGHTDDSVTYYFKDEKIMFTGDFLFKDSIGRCDLGGNIIDMKQSLNKIKDYDKNIVIYPGHGDKTMIKNELENIEYFMEVL